MTRVVVDGVPVLLCNVAGELYAVEDVCTHDGGALDGGELEGSRVMCPRHGALFDVTTGKPKTLPAYVPVDPFPVVVQDATIKLEVE